MLSGIDISSIGRINNNSRGLIYHKIKLVNWIRFSNTFLIKIKSNLEQIASILYTDYFLFFILGSVLLLIAMIGAIVLTITHEEGVKRQDLFAQISSEYDKTILNKNVK